MHIAAIARPFLAPEPDAVRARAQLAVEAAKAHRFGKVFVAALLEGLARVLPQAPTLTGMIETWPGDLASAGVIFRLNAGLHALARSGRHPGLSAIYREARTTHAPEPLLLDIALSLALRDGEHELLAWLQGPTQTNEVARVAGLAAVLLELDAAMPMPTHLLELGSSAGLNLNLQHYDIRLGRRQTGTPASPVRIAPQWRGSTPNGGILQIASAAGVDLNPLDMGCEADSERLQAYIWPGEEERAARLRAAITLAQQHPPRVDKGRAGCWLARQLARPQPPGSRRVVFHSMVLQYLPAAERALIDAALARAGGEAAPHAPLVRVGLEWNAPRDAVNVTVTQWNGEEGSGVPAVAARCHPYAEWFEWTGCTLPAPHGSR